MTKEEAIKLILEALKDTEDAMPEWPDDPVYGAAILTEKVGEVMGEAWGVATEGFEENSIKMLKAELALTGALAIRNLIYL